jgi:RHS repeat-associated protein
LGNLTSFTCDLTKNGMLTGSGSLTNVYMAGPQGERLIETDGSFNLKHYNVFWEGKLLGTFTGASDVQTNWHFALNDWLGTKRVTTTSAGAPFASVISGPFGDFQSQSGPGSDPSEEHFTSKVRDPNSNLDYFGARYYNSNMGRFLTPKYSMYGVIMELPQSWNKYSYVINRPLFASDPDGRCPWCVGAIVGGVVEGGFDLGKQLYNNGGSLSKVSWGEVGANTVGGAVAGALAVATGGASLVESAVVGDIAAGGTANVVGQAVTRALDPNTKSDDVLSAGEISQDAVAGFVGGGAGHLAGDFVHVPDEPIHNGRASTGALRRDNAKFAKYNNALANQITRATVAGSAATHTTNGGFSLFNWFFNQPPPPPPCATTSATDSRGNGTGLSGCQ